MINEDQQVPSYPASPTAPGDPPGRQRRRRLRGIALIASALTALSLVGAPQAAAGPSTATYTNPVSRSFADTFADPSIIEAKDGWWYAYSTADPLRSGDEPGIMHIARTRDFVQWEYQGTVFNESNRPTWATATSGLWAPDVRYIDGRYVLYYTVTDTTLNSGDDSAIGVATAPTPTGPWTPGDAPVVPPRPAPGGGFFWTFDPSGFTDVDGQRYLYYGSYFGGVFVSRVSEDGLTAVGDAKQVAINDKFEGSYVVRHGGYYYFMGSSANCCAGPGTGYSLFSGRSRSPMGPFVDADGIALTASKAGGTILTTQNGNRWIGAGHHAIATDHAGRDFVVYHALDRNNPWLTPVPDEPEGFPINRRPMLIDRIDWIDGWPRTRAGAGPSDSPQPAPVTGTDLGIRSANPAASGFEGLRQGPRDRQAGATARVRGSARTTEDVVGSRVRLRLDLRGNRPLEVRLGRGQDQVRVGVDRAWERLTVRSGAGRSAITRSDAIELDSRRWHTLVIEVDRSRVLAQLSEDDLNDPFAEVRLTDRDLRLRSAPLRLRSPRAVIDNVSIRRLAVDADRLVPVPRAGALIHAETFNRPLDSDDWTWVRRDPDATVRSGQLRWPLQAADLVGPGNNAGVLLSDRTPAGTWIAQTKLRLDLGEDTQRNFQQAGLIAYENDDDFARLSSVAIWNTRQVEFGRELTAAPNGRTIFGGAIIGTPAAEMWMRLAHTRNAAGEHLYRAAISRDGKSWTWGAVWTFKASANPKIGLIAHGGENPPVTARFSYLRFYETRWPAVDQPAR